MHKQIIRSQGKRARCAGKARRKSVEESFAETRNWNVALASPRHREFPVPSVTRGKARAFAGFTTFVLAGKNQE
jgi:hypothetical protein